MQGIYFLFQEGISKRMKKVYFQDLGSVSYKKAWDYQQSIFDNILSIKTQNRNLPDTEQINIENHL